MRALAKLLVGVCASAICAPVLAQDTNDSAAADDSNTIIVTATLRANDVQDIPIAVTAVTPAELNRQGINNIQTLGSVAPSFNIQSSQTESQGTSIRLRGIGTTGNNIGLESAVGVFIDGVYQSRPGIALGELVDVQQVEVLRGPQGTLFGRNTTAGALVIRNKAPDLNDVGGFLSGSYGNYNFVNLQGAVNLPVAKNTLGLRVTGAYRKRDGFLTNVDGEDTNDKNRYLLRGQLLWEPTADVSLRIIGDYQSADEKCCEAITLSSSANYPPTFTAKAFPLGVVSPSLPNLTNSSLVRIRPGQLKSNSSTFFNGNDQWGVSGQLDWDTGGPKLTAIVAYRDFHATSIQDDFQAVQVYSVAGVTEDRLPPNFDDIKTFTAEARLQGTAGILDYLVGGYYADEKIIEEASLTLGPDYQAYVGQANFGSPALLGLAAQAGAYLSSVAAGAPNPGVFATPISSDNSFGYNHYEQSGKSYSIFTHNILSLTDQFKVTLGARYVDDTKHGIFRQISASNPACLSALTLAGFPAAAANAALTPILGAATAGLLTNPAVSGGAAFVSCFPFAAPALGVSFLPKQFDLQYKDNEFVYTAQASYEPTPDILLYGGFTHGYKAGGFNLDSTAAAAGADPRFASEKIDAYEVGLKTTLFGGRGRANLAVFYDELSDFQVLEFTGIQFQTFNVDDVTARGAELEFFSQWTRSFSSSLAFTYTDAKYGDNCDARYVAARGANPALELCGTPLTNAPKVTAVGGLTFDGPINASDWGLLANLNVRYESSRRTSTKGLLSSGGVITGPVAYDVQDANIKVNARIGFKTPDRRFSFELWGRNLTNEITRSITFNTPLTGSGVATSRSAFVEDPRTYGVTARAEF